MKSHLTKDFRTCFRKLPERIQRLARENYKLWKAHPYHRSLDFKRVNKKFSTYSVRIGMGWDGERLVSKKTILLFGSGLAPIQNMTDLYGRNKKSVNYGPVNVYLIFSIYPYNVFFYIDLRTDLIIINPKKGVK